MKKKVKKLVLIGLIIIILILASIFITINITGKVVFHPPYKTISENTSSNPAITQYSSRYSFFKRFFERMRSMGWYHGSRNRTNYNPPAPIINPPNSTSNQTQNQTTAPTNPSIDCIEIWICTAWNNCTNNLQTRTCTDSNNCGKEFYKPELTKTCNSTDPTDPDPINETPTNPDTIEGTKYYVSTNGNDNNPGTFELPFKTIEKAKTQVAALKAQNSINQPVYILLRQGRYPLSQTLEFNSANSGTVNYPITYMSYPGEKAIISGGIPLNLNWQIYQGNIYKSNVGNLRFNSLYINDKRAIRSREPDNGFFGITNGGRDYFNAASNDVKTSWLNFNDAEVVIFNNWEQPRFKIAGVSGNKVTFSGSTDTNVICYDQEAGCKYFVENILEGLDEPGEWYLDKTNGNLYYYPLPNQNINNLEIIAPVIKKIINTNAASYIIFKNLIITETDWELPSGGSGGFQAGVTINTPHAITIGASSSNIKFENNIIKHLGGYAINIDSSQNIEISKNEFFDIAAGAVKIGPATGVQWGYSSDTAKANIITDNKIYSNNAVYRGAIGGIFSMLSADNTISHNLIYNTTYSGISVGWRWGTGDTVCKNNKIEYNLVYDTMLELNDGGAIYMLGKQPGTLINNNIFHDSKRRQHKNANYICGIYLDEGSKDMTLKNNIMYRSEWGLHLHQAQTNTIENNIFIDSGIFQAVFYGGSGNIFRKNIIYFKNSATLFGGDGSMDGTSDYNNFYNPTRSLSAISGQDKNSIFTDPLFVDYSTDNFRLKQESPTISRLGFQQIDTSTIGPRYATGF